MTGITDSDLTNNPLTLEFKQVNRVKNYQKPQSSKFIIKNLRNLGKPRLKVVVVS